MSEIKFTPPPVELGQVVHWYPHGKVNLSPIPAIVTRIGHDSLNLNLFDAQSYTMPIRDGVRHVSDPRTKSGDLVECGGWAHTPLTERLLALEKAFFALQAELVPLPNANADGSVDTCCATAR